MNFKTFTLVAFFISITIANAKNKEASTKENTEKTPLFFMENKGQVMDAKGQQHPEIYFSAKSKGLSLYLNNNGITYAFYKTITPKDFNPKTDALSSLKTTVTFLNMELLGANANASIIKEEKSNYYENYYTSKTPITNVGAFQKVTYKNIYPNIDWVIYSKEQAMKYDFIVHPGGNPKDIQLKYSNPENVNKNNDGSVDIATSLGKVTEETPFVYQSNNLEVKSEFLINENSLSFNIESYNQSIDLIVDPGIIWGMYFGTENTWDIMYSCFEDNTGNLFTASSVTSPLAGYPNLTYGQQATFSGQVMAMIAKIDENAQPLWATYYGANGSTDSKKIRPDATNPGAFLLCGSTNDANLTMLNGFMNTYPGGTNAGFVSRWDANGYLLNSTYIGGAGDDNASSVTSDANNIYICGKTQGLDAGITVSGTQTSYAGGSSDGYIASLDNNFNLSWCTYYGDMNEDILTDIGIQVNGSQDTLVVVGYSSSNGGMSYNMPPLSNNGSSYFGGAYDGVICKLNKFSGNKLVAKFFGGNGSDKINALCVPEYMSDAAHHTDYLFVVGETTSTNFYGLTGANSGGTDAFVAGGITIDLNGNYIGGLGYDAAYAVEAFDANLYIAGVSQGSSTNIGTANGFQPNWAGGQDGFLISAGGNTLSPSWGTYFGSDGNGVYNSEEIFLDIAINPHIPQNQSPYDFVTHVYAIGYSQGTAGVIYNNTNYNPNSFYTGTGTGIIGKFATTCALTPNPLSITTSTGNLQFCQGQTIDLIANGTNNYTWSNNNSQNPTNTVNQANTYTVTGTKYGCTFSKQISVSTIALPTVTISPSGGQYICEGGSLTLTANSATAVSYQWNLDGNPIIGETNNTINVSQQGGYSVEVTNSNGCVKTSFPVNVFVSTPPPASLTALADTNICTGNSVILQANNATVTYTWFFNGSPINGAFLRNYSASQSGVYSVTEVSPNGCSASSNSIQVTVYEYPAPTINADNIPYTCNGTNVGLSTPSNTNYAYQWNLNNNAISGANDSVYNAQSGGSYTVTVTNAGICSATSQHVILNPPSTPLNICVATVDDLSTHNVIVWDKPVSNSISRFNIYRVQTASIDTLVGSVWYSDLSEFHDYSCDPNVTQYDYKITAVDTCGDESFKSPIHRTILMTASLGFSQTNISWNQYIRDGITGSAVNQYRVWRDDNLNGNWTLIATLSPASTTYVDNNWPASAGWRYRVDVDWVASCTPTAKTTASTINTTRSNTRDNYRVTGLSQLDANNITLFPNPTSELVNVNLNANAYINNINLIDATGRLVKTISSTNKNNQAQINTSDLAKGIYFIEVNTNAGIVRKSFVRE